MHIVICTWCLRFPWAFLFSPFCLHLPPHSCLRICVSMLSHPTFNLLLLTGVLHLTRIHLNYFPARLTQLYALPPSGSYTVLKSSGIIAAHHHFYCWSLCTCKARNSCCNSQCAGIKCLGSQFTPFTFSLPGMGRCHLQQTWASTSALESAPGAAGPWVVWWQIQTVLEHWFPCSSLVSLWLFIYAQLLYSTPWTSG